MGACPKHRVSKLTRRKRQTHYKATKPTIATCSHCLEPKRAHRVCAACGFYDKKVKVFDVTPD